MVSACLPPRSTPHGGLLTVRSRGYIDGMRSRLASAAAVAASILTILSCATSSGTLLARVQDAEEADKKESPPPPPPPEDVKGLEIRTDPAGASVWLNSRYQGTTPVVIEGLRKGTYRLLITREGYQDVLVWLEYPGDSMRYDVTLRPLVGFVQVDVRPLEAEVTLDGRRVPQGITPVAVGSYAVAVSAFGYLEWRGRIVVDENAVTPLVLDLQPSAFDVSALSLARAVVNPENPGVLGFLEARFTVTGPGRGVAAVYDGAGRQVHREELPEFLTWDQRWRWHPPAAFPQGDYTLEISGCGHDGAASRREISFVLDRTARTVPRSSWSGGSGLLYVPAAEALPPGSFQAALCGVAAWDPSTDLLQAPVLIAFRTGLGGRVELDVSAGAILTGATAPLFGSLSARWQVVAPARPVGIGMAIEGKAALQGVPTRGILTTDTFANFTGLSLGVPLQLTLGAVSLLAEPAILASAWRIDYDSDPATAASPGAWMYWRAGVMLDAGTFVAGASASARSLPLPDGLFAVGLPVQVGVEAHALIPETHVLVGAIMAGEIASPADWYLIGGISLGLLF